MFLFSFCCFLLLLPYLRTFSLIENINWTQLLNVRNNGTINGHSFDTLFLQIIHDDTVHQVKTQVHSISGFHHQNESVFGHLTVRIPRIETNGNSDDDSDNEDVLTYAMTPSYQQTIDVMGLLQLVLCWMPWLKRVYLAMEMIFDEEGDLDRTGHSMSAMKSALSLIRNTCPKRNYQTGQREGVQQKGREPREQQSTGHREGVHREAVQQQASTTHSREHHRHSLSSDLPKETRLERVSMWVAHDVQSLKKLAPWFAECGLKSLTLGFQQLTKRGHSQLAATLAMLRGPHGIGSDGLEELNIGDAMMMNSSGMSRVFSMLAMQGARTEGAWDEGAVRAEGNGVAEGVRNEGVREEGVQGHGAVTCNTPSSSPVGIKVLRASNISCNSGEQGMCDLIKTLLGADFGSALAHGNGDAVGLRGGRVGSLFDQADIWVNRGIRTSVAQRESSQVSRGTWQSHGLAPASQAHGTASQNGSQEHRESPGHSVSHGSASQSHGSHGSASQSLASSGTAPVQKFSKNSATMEQKITDLLKLLRNGFFSAVTHLSIARCGNPMTEVNLLELWFPRLKEIEFNYSCMHYRELLEPADAIEQDEGDNTGNAVQQVQSLQGSHALSYAPQSLIRKEFTEWCKKKGITTAMTIKMQKVFDAHPWPKNPLYAGTNCWQDLLDYTPFALVWRSREPTLSMAQAIPRELDSMSKLLLGHGQQLRKLTLDFSQQTVLFNRGLLNFVMGMFQRIPWLKQIDLVIDAQRYGEGLAWIQGPDGPQHRMQPDLDWHCKYFWTQLPVMLTALNATLQDRQDDERQENLQRSVRVFTVVGGFADLIQLKTPIDLQKDKLIAGLQAMRMDHRVRKAFRRGIDVEIAEFLPTPVRITAPRSIPRMR